MPRIYVYQETIEFSGEPIDGEPITLEKEIWSDGEKNHEPLTMAVDEHGYWWAYERDSGTGKRLTAEEHQEAKSHGYRW